MKIMAIILLVTYFLAVGLNFFNFVTNHKKAKKLEACKPFRFGEAKKYERYVRRYKASFIMTIGVLTTAIIIFFII